MTQKQLLRQDYYRIRANFRRMMKRDLNKYLVPKDYINYLPDTPRIITNEKLFKNAAVDRIAGAIRRLQGRIQAYKNYRSRWDTLDDAKLQEYVSKLTEYSSKLNLNPDMKLRADRLLEDFGNSLNKRQRALVSKNITKKWPNVIKETEYYIFGYRKPDSYYIYHYKKLMDIAFKDGDKYVISGELLLRYNELIESITIDSGEDEVNDTTGW